MIQESFLSEEKVYVTGLNLEHARARLRQYGGEDTAQKAYHVLDYFDAEEGNFEIFEFVTTTRITKIDPPYTKRN